MKSTDLIIGAHLSIAKGFYAAYQEAKEILKGNALQIFTKNPRGGASKPLEKDDVQKCQVFQQENHFFMVAHCSYLLNFAKSHTSDPWPNNSLIEDINRVDMLRGQAVVLHIGKKLEMTEDEAMQNIVENIHYVLDKTSDKKIMILLENTAGQGTEIGYRFEELGKLMKAIHHHRVKVCFDTCHAFSAGYDLRGKKEVENTLQEFDRHIGLENVLVFHLNDTKKTLGSRVDRHEDIEFGNIGLDGILEIVRFAQKHHIPCILETPAEHSSYAKQIQLIKDAL
jgi:deoxyribonuclease-4